MVKLNEYLFPIRTGILVEGPLDAVAAFRPDHGSTDMFMLDFLYPRTETRNTAVFSIAEGRIIRRYALVKISGNYHQGNDAIEEIQLDLTRDLAGKALFHLDAYKKVLEWDFWGNERESAFYKKMTEHVEKAIIEKFEVPAACASRG